MMRHTRLATAVAGLTAATALALLPASAAIAHNYLVSSDPAAESTVTAPPATVSLTFNDRVLDLAGDSSSNFLTVTGPDADTRHFETGCATVTDRVVSAPVALGRAGSYTVTYQIVSADGHTVSNSFAFSYQPPAGTPEAAGSATTACGAADAPAAEDPAAIEASPSEDTVEGSDPLVTASTPQPLETSSDSGLGLVIGIAITIVTLAVIGVAIVVLTTRRKPSSMETATGDENENEKAKPRKPAPETDNRMPRSPSS